MSETLRESAKATNAKAVNPETSAAKPGGGRTQLIIMLVVASFSLFGSYFLFLAMRDGGQWGTSNHGAFVQPHLNAAALAVEPVGEPALDWSEHWWLLTVSADNCAAACAEAVHLLRQMQILLNKDSDRVRRAVLTTGTTAVALQADYPALAVARLPSLAVAGRDEALAPGIYIVDPQGNFVFHYPLDVEGSAMLKDLKKLLKLSQIG